MMEDSKSAVDGVRTAPEPETAEEWTSRARKQRLAGGAVVGVAAGSKTAEAAGFLVLTHGLALALGIIGDLVLLGAFAVSAVRGLHAYARREREARRIRIATDHLRFRINRVAR